MMEDPKITVIGPSSKNKGPHKFYKGFKYTFDGLERIISLGKFFFMKISDDVPICVGELQLIWEDRNCTSELASVKLYFVPEDTPEGRLLTHGEDEILAYSEKMTLKLDDLVNLIVHNVTWIEGRKAVPDEVLLTHPEHGELVDAFKMNSYGLSYKDVQKETESVAKPTKDETEIVVMSYPRYCRYRGVLKRLENCTDKWLKHALVCAIGGFSSKSTNCRIYFCRDIFDHPDLDEFELRCEHFAPSLKTRDRRRKSWKRENSSDASEESSSSASVTPTGNTPTKPVTKPIPRPVPRPIVRPGMKPGPKPGPRPGPKPFLSPFPNPVLAKIDAQSAKLGKRSTPLRNGIRLDKMKVSKDEQAFLIDLHKYMKSRNTPIGRIPSLGFKQIDLYQFYTMAEKIGGYEAVTTKRMWKFLFDQLGGNAGNTSAATCTRRHYERLLLPYEKWKKGDEIKPVPKKRKKRRIKQEMENGDAVSENGRTEPTLAESVIKKETEQDKLASQQGSELKFNVKAENVPIKSEEMGRKEEVQNRAMIIKQELENMKMRKDAKRMLLHKEKIWEDRRKYKYSEKGRKPSAGQKTVRQLLNQTGRGEELNENPAETMHLQKPSVDETQNKVKTEVNDVKTDNNQLHVSGDGTHLPSSQGSAQNLISPINFPRPMFFPPLQHMGGLIPGVQGMQPMRFPFMIPQLGMPGIPTAMQPIHPLMSPLSGDNKPLNELSRLVTKQKEIIDIPSAIDKQLQPGGQIKPSAMTPSSAPPPSNHTQVPKGPLTAGPSHRKGPIGPAHSNELKRQNPFQEANKNNFPELQLKSSKDSLSSSHKENEFKRQKMSVSPDQVYKPNSGLGEAPVLDLSMKTLRAQEEKQMRGESLLFSTCFNKNRANQTKGTTDAPEDLSVKASKSSSQSVSSTKHVPLNVPLHPLQSGTRSFTSGTASVPSTTTTNTTQYQDKQEKSVSGIVPPFSLGVLPSSLGGLTTSIGGLPIDFSAFVHPAFRNPMMIQPGTFPTPVQLQQMIQGQVAANFPMLRPGLMQNPVQLFQPAFPVSSAGIGVSNPVKTDSKR